MLQLMLDIMMSTRVSVYNTTVSDINLDGVSAPATYTFDRSGATSVSYGGQTTRIKMAKELSSALKVNTNTEVQLDNMYADGTGFDDDENIWGIMHLYRPKKWAHSKAYISLEKVNPDWKKEFGIDDPVKLVQKHCK